MLEDAENSGECNKHHYLHSLIFEDWKPQLSGRTHTGSIPGHVSEQGWKQTLNSDSCFGYHILGRTLTRLRGEGSGNKVEEEEFKELGGRREVQGEIPHFQASGR